MDTAAEINSGNKGDPGLSFDLTGITGGQAETINVAGVVEGPVGCVLSDNQTADSSQNAASRDLATIVTTAVEGHGDPGTSGPVTMTGITGGTGHNMNMIGVQNVTVQENVSLKKLEESTLKEINERCDGMIRVTSLDTVTSKLKDGVKWVTITGSPGEGKTRLGFMVLRELKNQGNRVFNVNTPEELYRVRNEGINSVVMLNDVFGAYTFDTSRLNAWEKAIHSVLDDQEIAKGNSMVTRVIFISRNNVLENAKSHLGDYRDKIIPQCDTVNLSGKLKSEEKLEILNHHLEACDKSIPEQVKKRVASGSHAHGFPHCCKMFADLTKRHGQEVDIESFFEKPLDFLDLTTNVLIQRQNCRTFFKIMVRRTGKLDPNTITDDETRSQVKTAIKELQGSYLEKSLDVVQFSHPSIFISVGQALADLDDIFFVQNADIALLRQTLAVIKPEQRQERGYINVHQNKTLVETLVSRLKDEIFEREFSIFGCKLSRNESFCRRLLEETTTQRSVWLQRLISGVRRQRKVGIQRRDRFGRTMLSMAAEHGNTTAVRVLVDHGADVKEVDCHRRTALHWLCSSTEATVDCLKILTDKITDVDKLDSFQHTPLQLLCKDNPNINLIGFVLDQGADVNLQSGGMTALHYLCGNSSDKNCIELVLQRGVDLSLQNFNGNTALHLLCKRSVDANCLKLLLDKAANVNTQNKKGWTALHLLCMASTKNDSIQLVVEHGADVNIQDYDEERTPLHWLCSISRDRECIQLLLDKRADVNIKDVMRNTALHYLCSKSVDNGCIKLLLDHGADVNITEMVDRTALHVVCSKSADSETVRLLLEKDADVNKQEACGKTALHYLCRQNLGSNNSVSRDIIDSMKLLLERHADVNIQEDYGNTALHYLCSKLVDNGCIKLLLDHGADVNITDRWRNRTALHMVCSESADSETVRLLLEKDADVKKQDYYGMTALHYLCSHNMRSNSTKPLLGRHADVNIRDLSGKTALHCLCLTSMDIRCIKLLLERGADRNIRDRKGRRPLDLLDKSDPPETNTVRQMLMEL